MVRGCLDGRWSKDVNAASRTCIDLSVNNHASLWLKMDVREKTFRRQEVIDAEIGNAIDMGAVGCKQSAIARCRAHKSQTVCSTAAQQAVVGQDVKVGRLTLGGYESHVANECETS